MTDDKTLVRLRLIDEWDSVLKKAWSVRLIVVAAILSGLEVILPFFVTGVPSRWFALLIFLVVGGAFVARLVAQRNLP